MNKQTEKYRVFFVYLSLTVITLAVFWRVHGFEFINYDDPKYVTENLHVQKGLGLESVVWAFTSSHYFMWHPVTSLSHIVDYELFGLNAGWHHLTNLALHIANSLLLFEILRRMTGRIWPSAFVAAVFAVHPLNVESVAWIAERKNVMYGFFWMLTIVAYIRYAKRPATSNYLLVILFFSLTLMSKPAAVTLPFVLLLLDYWPLGRFQWNVQSRSEQLPEANLSAARYKKLSTLHLVEEKIPLLLLSAILCVVTIITLKGCDALKLNEILPFGFRLANALVSYVSYICKMIYPSHLAVFYPHPRFSLPLWKPIASLLLLGAVSVSLIYLGRRRAYLIVGWFWYLGTLVPVIGLLQAGKQAMADRYAYIPLIGLFIIVAWGSAELLGDWKYRRITLVISSIAVITILSVCTWIQTGYWRNSQRLFEHTLKVTTGNYVACNGLGLVLIEQNRFDEAVDLLRRALLFKPDHADTYYILGVAYGKLGRYGEMIEVCKQAIRIKPDLAEAYGNLGFACSLLGRNEEAIEAYKQALGIKPDLATIHYNLGNTYSELGRWQEATEAFKQAIKFKPDYADAYYNLGGICYDKLGRLQEAIEAFKQTIKFKPDNVEAHYNLGNVLAQSGQYNEAIQAFKQAVRVKPDYADAHFSLGVAFLVTGDKDSAAKEYEILKALDAEKANNLFSLISK